MPCPWRRRGEEAADVHVRDGYGYGGTAAHVVGRRGCPVPRPQDRSERRVDFCTYQMRPRRGGTSRPKAGGGVPGVPSGPPPTANGRKRPPPPAEAIPLGPHWQASPAGRRPRGTPPAPTARYQTHSAHTPHRHTPTTSLSTADM
ncbi:hypothetical protein San01_36550 [Streptomyces angustmyceticus]|uniref:Uncharacterized protein n=1 Tax=Streptomyces angustmyceticus TaxID=285578 RepID=A0A5J4LKJ3_9ACTN|nr:hypothetical protein San01_36550 [Streptomyces angustmyceticus]